MNSALEIKNLNKSYKDFQLKNLNITLEKGYITGFIGPNGAGKSTTIKAILNLINKDSGNIYIFGKDHIRDEIEIKNRVGVVLDEGYYYDDLTLKQMKNLIAPMYTNWDDNIFNKYIKQFNLPLDKKISQLSKGMRMKYSITIALSHKAELFIMDEPTSGLDPLVRDELLDILMEIMQEENKTVFFSTHITSDLDKIADYLILINDGEIILNASKDEIIDNHGLVRGSKDLLTKELAKDFINIKQNEFGFEGLTSDKGSITRMLGDKVVIEKPTIEDIMLYYVRRK